MMQSSDILDNAMKSVQDNGFINYFGFQRVGYPKFAIRSHHIGQAALQNNWESAVTLLFDINDTNSQVLFTSI